MFQTLKRPVLVFQNVEDLKQCELKEEVTEILMWLSLFKKKKFAHFITMTYMFQAFADYLQVGKQMQQFELARLNSWIEKAQEDVRQAMTRNVMRLEESVRKYLRVAQLSDGP